MEFILVSLSVAAMLQPAALSHSSVYVKFLSPLHGYSHNLQVDSSGVAISKESRIYPGDIQPFGLQQNHLPKNQQGYAFSNHNQFQQSFNLNHRFRQGYSLNKQLQPAYPLNIQYQPGYPISNQYQQDHLLSNQYQPPQQITGYTYVRPQKLFEEFGLSRENFPPTREHPSLSRPEAEMTYDPNLISGPEAARYVNYLFNQGELFFHLIPHERLVLMNQQERITNNLAPHILASIRPGHPFFHHR